MIDNSEDDSNFDEWVMVERPTVQLDQNVIDEEYVLVNYKSDSKEQNL